MYEHKRFLVVLFSVGFLAYAIFSALQPYSPPHLKDMDRDSHYHPASDTLIRGVVKKIRYDDDGHYLGFPGTYKVAAYIVISITEIKSTPENFECEVGDLIGVSYDYIDPPECGTEDFVEVYGYWVPVLDVPAAKTIIVADFASGSYVKVLNKG